MSKHVMVDLETLGNNSQSVIIAIGAVEFDTETLELGHTFYQVVDPQSCVSAGMKMDASTVMWWMRQDVKAKEAFNVTGTHIADVLRDFSAWYPKAACFWGNGATFDNVIMSNAYYLTDLVKPWPYWGDRCYRTLKNLYPDIVIEDYGVAHNALDDAIKQAKHTLKIVEAKGLKI